MKFSLKRLKKPVIYFIGGIIGIYVIVGLYSLIFEQDKLAMDRYSFEQLNLVENTLKDISKENYNFNNLQEFNSIYTKQIKLIIILVM